MNQCAWLASHVADEFRHRWLYQKSPANPLMLLQAVSMFYALAIAATQCAIVLASKP